MSFPTAGVLDTFDRADASDLGPNYGTIFSFTCRPHIVSNACHSCADLDNFFADGYWNVQTFGPDCEVYVEVTQRGSGVLDLFARFTGSLDNWSGYQVQSLPDNSFNIVRWITGGDTQIFTTTQALGNGDSFGMSCIGNTMTPYYKPAAGSWTSLGSVDDSNNPGAGYVGLLIEGDGGPFYNNFGGGDAVLAAPVRRSIGLPRPVVYS